MIGCNGWPPCRPWRWSLPAAAAMTTAAPGTVVQVAQADARFSTLVEAVLAADLATTLSGSWAIHRVRADQRCLRRRCSPNWVSRRRSCSPTRHCSLRCSPTTCCRRASRASQVPAGKAVATVQGGVFKIDAAAGPWWSPTAATARRTITATDVPASNGVIHVIDRVLLPADKTIVQTAQALPGFQHPRAGGDRGRPGRRAERARAAHRLRAHRRGVRRPAGRTRRDARSSCWPTRALLTQVLTYHVVPGRVLKADVPVATPITTLQGDTSASA